MGDFLAEDGQKTLVLRIGGDTMQVTKLTAERINVEPKKHLYTEEELQREYSYILAEKTTKMLLDNELISVDEFNKISERNRQTFSPYLAEIMP